MVGRLGHQFPPAYRIRKRRDFLSISARGQKKHSRSFVILQMKKESGFTRLGLTVSKKVGGAVERNRVKRLLREFFRNHYNQLPPHTDISIIAKKGAADIDYPGVCKELKFLTVK